MGRWTEAARKKAAQLTKESAFLTDEEALSVAGGFLPWDAAAQYAVGERVAHGGLLYRCLLAHTAQADWAPGLAPSLWVCIDDPTEEWPEWRQPLGSEDAYKMGAKVSYGGKHWVSLHPANVWVPGTPGVWEERP